MLLVNFQHTICDHNEPLNSIGLQCSVNEQHYGTIKLQLTKAFHRHRLNYIFVSFPHEHTCIKFTMVDVIKFHS